MSDLTDFTGTLQWLAAHGLSPGWVLVAWATKVGTRGLVGGIGSLVAVLVDVRDLLHDLRSHLREYSQ